MLSRYPNVQYLVIDLFFPGNKGDEDGDESERVRFQFCSSFVRLFRSLCATCEGILTFLWNVVLLVA